MATTNFQAFSGDVEVASNLQVGTANLFVDITTGQVGIGKTNPTQLLDIAGNVAANVNTLFVDTVTSRVGIGTSNPSAPLEVSGNVTVGSTLTVSGFRITAAAAATDDLQAITTAGGDTDKQIHITNATRAISSSTGALRVGDSGAPGGIGVVGNVYVGDTVTTQDLSVDNVISDFAVNTDDFFVDISESKVGVSTTQPHAELHVVGNVYVSSNLTVDADTLHVDAANDRVGVNTKNPEASLHLVGNAFVSSNLEVGTADLFVDTVNSRVGIGVTNPDTMLEVAGNAKISSVYRETFTVSSVETGTYVYLGRFSTQANAIVEIVSAGNSQGNSNKFEFQRQYDSKPHVSGIDSDHYLRHRFFYKSVTTSEYDVWHERDGTSWGTPAGTMTYRIQSHIYSKPSDPGSSGSIECLYSLYITNEPGSFKVGIGTYAPTAPFHVNSSATHPDAYFAARIGGYDGVLDIGTFVSDYGAETIYLQTKIDAGSGYISDRNKLCLQPSGGNVGIRTTSPNHPLSVFGSGGSVGGLAQRSWFKWDHYGISHDNATASGGTGLYSEQYIMSSTGFLAQNGYSSGSDFRIKKDIVDADDVVALETLRLLKPKRYKYKDEKGRGTVPVWGFIAQEVAETLPYSVTLTEDFIPNIYEMANVSDSNVITFTNFNTSNLESNASTIRSYGKDDAMRLLKITEVIDEHSVRVDQDLSEWTGSFDESGNVVAGNQLFVYGEEIDDFHFLKKDSIWTVATSALQEIDRQLQAEKARNDALEARIAALESA
jgi:hypothetical protein